jgi:hypothetical protein
MLKFIRASLGLSVLSAAFAAMPALGLPLSNDGVRQAIIRDSIASYPGPCACPYNSMRNGRACGGRSAYSRPGGYAPLCYPRDITPEMIRQYRASHGN